MSAAHDPRDPDARMDAEVERLLVRERNRTSLTPRHHEALAARIHSLAAQLDHGTAVAGARGGGLPWWLRALLRPAVALTVLTLLAGGALAMTGWWRQLIPARPAALTTTAPFPAGHAAEPSPALREEIALLSRARQALAERAFERAAQHLADHARRYPAGALIEEREGLGVMLLWHTGDPANANAAARRFQQRYPDSPLNRPIRALAAEPRAAPRDVH